MKLNTSWTSHKNQSEEYVHKHKEQLGCLFSNFSTYNVEIYVLKL